MPKRSSQGEQDLMLYWEELTSCVCHVFASCKEICSSCVFVQGLEWIYATGNYKKLATETLRMAHVCMLAYWQRQPLQHPWICISTLGRHQTHWSDCHSAPQPLRRNESCFEHVLSSLPGITRYRARSSRHASLNKGICDARLVHSKQGWARQPQIAKPR